MRRLEEAGQFIRGDEGDIFTRFSPHDDYFSVIDDTIEHRSELFP
ncbi:MAG TPA: hypothetical protein VNX18_12995 [Bryobacteraceae bacterium]|nr:hypothetical protein [Bryobacteraceae bacterium]